MVRSKTFAKSVKWNPFTKRKLFKRYLQRKTAPARGGIRTYAKILVKITPAKPNPEIDLFETFEQKVQRYKSRMLLINRSLEKVCKNRNLQQRNISKGKGKLIFFDQQNQLQVNMKDIILKCSSKSSYTDDS